MSVSPIYNINHILLFSKNQLPPQKHADTVLPFNFLKKIGRCNQKKIDQWHPSSQLITFNRQTALLTSPSKILKLNLNFNQQMSHSAAAPHGIWPASHGEGCDTIWPPALFFFIRPLLHHNSFSNPKLYISSPEDPQKWMHYPPLPRCNKEKDVHSWQHHALGCGL